MYDELRICSLANTSQLSKTFEDVHSMSTEGPFASLEHIADVCKSGERYVPSIDPYNAAMHLGHMASYKHALRYAWGRHVLEIGCGVGYGAHYLASFGASLVVAIDKDSAALEYARKAYFHSKVHYQQGSGSRLPFADGAFEFVLSSQVIEHLTSPELFLSEIKRVLKPGGFCLVTTPNKDLFSPRDIEGDNVFHVNEMSLSEFETVGRGVFPKVEMAGIAQDCLIRKTDNTIVTKDNRLLRLEDYEMRKNDVIHCENMLLFGHTQANGEFSTTLPDSISSASTRLAPCFWDSAIGQWVEMGLFPDSEATETQITSRQDRVIKIFRMPYDKFFRIEIALNHVGTVPLEIILLDHSSDHVIAHTVIQPQPRRFSLTFAPLENSSKHTFRLELHLKRSLLDTLLRKKHTLPKLEDFIGQLAVWTFHTTLPLIVS
jgi:ubiquinone/menaquinone biosynthesis C-methylase UbiE